MAAAKKAAPKKAAASKPDPININPANKGKLRGAAGVKKGQPIPDAELDRLAKSKNPKTRERANFAKVAKTWNHS